MAEIFGINENYANNVEIDDLESERQTLIGVWIDDSGSMSTFECVMRDCLNRFKSAIKGSKESDEMLISRTLFGNDVLPGGYQFIDDFNDDYHASGMTKLYDCIVDGQKRLFDGAGNGYMEKLQANGIKAKAVIAIFSDGEDTYSNATLNDARRAIEFLHSKEIVVAFIAFGNNAHGIAQKLGIEDKNILETDATESDLRRIFMILSKSAISASKSAAAATTTDDSFFTV